MPRKITRKPLITMTHGSVDEEDPKFLKKKYSFLIERERLLNNVEAARTLAEKMSLLTSQLELLMEETKSTRADAHALKGQLNLKAEEFGLEPIPIKKHDVKTPSD